MKFKSLVKAYLWLEVGFVTYLFLRKEPITNDPNTKKALSDLEAQLKGTLDGTNEPAQNPQANSK